MQGKYSDKELQNLANHWDDESGESHSLSSYLLACADSAGEIHSVLKQTVLQTDPADRDSPWVDWPSEPGSLQPPASGRSGEERWMPKRKLCPTA